jgi:antitoxin (DNA-binding transcriptional repressor) of toxin-antitoxin stability system
MTDPIPTREGGPVVVTKNGRPKAVLVAARDEEELERLVLSREPFNCQRWQKKSFSQYDVKELLAEVRKHHAHKSS